MASKQAVTLTCANPSARERPPLDRGVTLAPSAELVLGDASAGEHLHHQAPNVESSRGSFSGIERSDHLERASEEGECQRCAAPRPDGPGNVSGLAADHACFGDRAAAGGGIAPREVRTGEYPRSAFGSSVPSGDRSADRLVGGGDDLGVVTSRGGEQCRRDAARSGRARVGSVVDLRSACTPVERLVEVPLIPEVVHEACEQRPHVGGVPCRFAVDQRSTQVGKVSASFGNRL